MIAMGDITLCLGINCTKKQTCHRYLAKPKQSGPFPAQGDVMIEGGKLNSAGNIRRDWATYVTPKNLEFDGCDMYWPEDDSDG
jgi:hypothetical protein